MNRQDQNKTVLIAQLDAPPNSLAARNTVNPMQTNPNPATCGFAAAQCGKALPYRSNLNQPEATPRLRRSLKRQTAGVGKAEPYRTVRRQSRKYARRQGEI
jgi:hypothetical protein